MPFGAHETMEVHEILNEKVNQINHFAWYARQAQNPQLRQMIERHLQSAVEFYDQIVSYTHDYNHAQPQMQGVGMVSDTVEQIKYGLHNPARLSPQTGGGMKDTDIASAVLLCHKNSAKNAMTASLECADPNVRQLLMNTANACAIQAYEVFQLMNEQGQYQVPTMSEHTAKTFLHTFQPVQEAPEAPYVQPAMSQTSSPSYENSNQRSYPAAGGQAASAAYRGMNSGMGQGAPSAFQQPISGGYSPAQASQAGNQPMGGGSRMNSGNSFSSSNPTQGGMRH
ncbi:spore coat protein [Paenibacillus aurantius]|uniref:Spore coat protein n=1 Tax=Paenibacillus aurantius TaxID=2918900 RepID=A0AA96LAS5_9BACL|nr:spore coat protein [Paenibacillus aurantius]WNQ09780.1 spore coat protein [Paenibacillus aurantius]